MKKSIYNFALIILSISFFKTQAQPTIKQSFNGYTLSNRGTIRILVVFAQIDYSSAACTLSSPIGTVTDWQIPSEPCNNPLICGAPSWAETWFDHEWSGSPSIPGNMTDYFYEASMHEYIVLGDYLSVVIPCSAFNGTLASAAIDYINQQISINNLLNITTAHGYTLNDFDNWTVNQTGLPKNNVPNNKIDLSVVVWKNFPGLMCGDGGNGISPSAMNINSFPINFQTHWNACNLDVANYTFTAEFLHGLFGGNNWHSVGGAGPYTFMTYPHFYCTTAQYDGISNSYCAYDRWFLGWKGDKQYTTSALDAAGTNEVLFSDNNPLITNPYPYVYSQENNPEGGTYILRDFCMSGDAIRIKLPHINWQQIGDVKNQYLWLENHQMVSMFDHGHYDNATFLQNTPLMPGMYAYIQAGKDRINGVNPADDIYVDASSGGGNQNSWPDPNSNGSWLMPLSAEGNYDFKYRTDLIDYWCLGGNGSSTPRVPIDKSQSLINPFTGCSDLFNFFDYTINSSGGATTDGVLFNDNSDVYRGEVQNGIFVCAAQGYGDEEDAFTLTGNNKLSISSNPAPVPVYTYKSNGFHNNYSNANPNLFTWENRKIHLNGLSIEIIDEIPNNTWGNESMMGLQPMDLILKIRWDDYEVKNNVRWCGDILLYPSVHFSAANLPLDVANEISLLLKTGNTLWLDRGKSPTQHVSYEQISGEHFFTQPSRFTATVNSYILQEYNSTIHVDNKSTLLLEAGSKLEMNSGSQLLVTNGSTLIIENDAELLMHDAYIYIDETSTLIIRNLNPNAGLCLGQVQNVPSNALMEVKGAIRYENGAPMNYKGSGKLVFIGTAAKIEFEDAINSTVEFIAPDLLFPALELREEANITLNANSMMMGNMIIEVHDNSTLKFEDAEYVMLQDIHVNGYSVTDATNTAMEITDVQSIEIGSLRFNQDANAAMQGALKITGIPATSIISMYDVRIDRAIHPLAISGGDYFKCSQLFINLTGDPGSDVLVTLKKLNKSIIKTSVLKYGNTGISISGSSTFLQNILYLDGTELGYMETGIDAKGAQLFLRNGSGITSTAIGIKAEGNVIYDDQNNPITFNSMITLGDVGCANILQFRNYGILATNTLLNMDANLHAIANQSDPIPNSMVRASSNSGTFIKICYTNKNPNASIIPTTIYASGNYWGGITPIAPGGSQSPDFDVKKYGNYACVGFNQNIIPVETAPLTNCEVLLNDCESCESVTNENEGAAQNMLIGNAYKMLYGAFTPIDTTYTRNPFEEISILRMELDAMNNIWTVYDIEDSAYVVSERSVHRILVSRVLRPVGTSSNERKGIRDIFESIKENPKESLFSFKLYPNPAGQHIQLTSNYSGLIFCSLYDIQGRLMSYYVFQQQHNSQAINIEALTDGIYCLRITDAQHKLLDKITFIKSN